MSFTYQLSAFLTEAPHYSRIHTHARDLTLNSSQSELLPRYSNEKRRGKVGREVFSVRAKSSSRG
jgi:hypothetical protein